VSTERAARAVEARRGELGLTQQQLADAAGVDIKTIGNLESRGRWPIARTRAAIEQALGWQPGEMKRIADEAERSPPARLRDGTREAIRKDLAGDPVLAEQVIAYVEGLASGRIPPAPASPGADPPAAGESRQRGRA
jgi:transcriptional regulator with XRE-family HTH domain